MEVPVVFSFCWPVCVRMWDVFLSLQWYQRTRCVLPGLWLCKAETDVLLCNLESRLRQFGIELAAGPVTVIPQVLGHGRDTSS
jgi:hypothetical protein